MERFLRRLALTTGWMSLAALTIEIVWMVATIFAHGQASSTYELALVSLAIAVPALAFIATVVYRLRMMATASSQTVSVLTVELLTPSVVALLHFGLYGAALAVIAAPVVCAAAAIVWTRATGPMRWLAGAGGVLLGMSVTGLLRRGDESVVDAIGCFLGILCGVALLLSVRRRQYDSAKRL